MKNKYIIIAALFLNLGYAQDVTTGVNTVNPIGTLHVDGMGDNLGITPTRAQQGNDFIVKPSGDVGIGRTDPAYKLDVRSGGTFLNPSKAIRIIDGYERDGFVLTTDGDGIANWQPIDISIYKEEFTGDFSIEGDEDRVYYTGKSIVLPQGYWLITFSLGIYLYPSPTYEVGSIFLRLRLMDSENPSDISAFPTNVSQDAVRPTLASASFSSGESRGMLYGSLAIKNESVDSKEYYIFVDNTAGSIYNQVDLEFGWNETFIYYFRIAEPN